MTSPSPPVSEQRAALTAVTARASSALLKAWPSLRGRRPAAVRDGLKQLIPALSNEYGTAAAALGTDVYAVLRDAARVDGGFVATPADPPTIEELNRMVGWAVQPLFSSEPNESLTLYRVRGGLQKAVADEYRDTIQDAAIADPQATGWQRSARPTGCPFCVLLAARGAVYTETSVDFGAHRNCSCLAVPAFDGQQKPVRAFEPTSRSITAADRARVRRWIAAHH